MPADPYNQHMDRYGSQDPRDRYGAQDPRDHYHGRDNRSRGTRNTSRSRNSRPRGQNSSQPRRMEEPYYEDENFPGLTINPVEHDDVSAVTEGVMTHYQMPPHKYNDYGDEEEPSITQVSTPNDDMSHGYDDFCRNVFGAPTVAGEMEKEAREKERQARKRMVVYIFLALVVVILGVFGVLFGIGILEIPGDNSSQASTASASSNLVGTSDIPTRAPLSSTTNELLPETSAPTLTTDSKVEPVDSPTQEPDDVQTPGPTNSPSFPPPSPSPTSEPTISPTVPDATSNPTDPPVATPEPTSSPTVAPTPTPRTSAPVATPAPTDATPSPTTSAPKTPSPTASPTPGLTTVRPPFSEWTAMPTANERFIISRLNIRMEEEAYAPYSTYADSKSNITKNINLELRLNGNIYRSYSCYQLRVCDPYRKIPVYEWVPFPDTTQWYMDGTFAPIFGNNGLETGVLELYIHVEDGDDYAWKVDPSIWFQTQAGFETPVSQDINGNGPWMRWQFDVDPAAR